MTRHGVTNGHRRGNDGYDRQNSHDNTPHFDFAWLIDICRHGLLTSPV
jgi:hypothetical protein